MLSLQPNSLSLSWISEWPCWQITLSPVPGTWAVLTTLPLAAFASTLFQPSSHMTSLRGLPPRILHWTSMQWSQNCNFVTNVLLKADPFTIAQTNSNIANCLYSQTSYQLAKNLPNTKQLHDFEIDFFLLDLNFLNSMV